MAEAMGWPCETVIASIREPSDFAGLPIVADGEVGSPRPAGPAGWRQAARACCSSTRSPPPRPAVQAALLRVVLERVVGDLALPPAVVVMVAAPTRPSRRPTAGSCPRRWPTASATWTGRSTPSRSPRRSAGFGRPRVPTLPAGRLGDDIPGARGLVAAFINVRPGLACDLPTDAARAGRGWPSPRTWEMAARLWAAATVAGASHRGWRPPWSRGPSARARASSCSCGNWRWTSPTPRTSWPIRTHSELPERGDRAYAVLSAVAAAVAANPTAGAVARRLAHPRSGGGAGARRSGGGCSGAVALPTPGCERPPEVKLFAPLLRDAGLL